MTLKTDLFTLIDPLVSETLIWADGNSPRPALPYVAMKVMGIRRINGDWRSESVGSDGLQTVKGDREFTLNIQRFGTDSVESLSTLADKLRLTTNIEKFNTAKLPIIDAEDVVDVAALLDNSQIEPRASLDVFLRLKSSLTDNVGYIDTVEIETVTIKPDGTDMPIGTITVTV
jgi:hypothetical protein